MSSRFCILVALVLSAHAQVPPGNPMSAPNIDPSLEKPLTQFIATEKAREASIHFLHFVLEDRATYISANGTAVQSPIPGHLEGWVNTANGMRRYEYRPQVSHMVDGPNPVYSRDLTMINDGKMNYTIDPETDLSNIPSSPAVQNNGMPIEDGSWNDMMAMSAAMLVNSALHHENFMGVPPNMRAKWTTWNGVKVIEITQGYRDKPDGPVTQQQVFRLDPAHDLALCSYSIAFPERNKSDKPQNVYEVDRFAKSSAGFFYPVVYRMSYGATGTDIYSNTTQQTVTTITTYEPLAALPAHITDVPKPKGSEYVGDNNEVVQPPEMHLTVLDAKTKKPVANAPVTVRMSASSLMDTTLTTDANGAITLALPKEEVKFLSLNCDQPPYVPLGVKWSRYANPLRLPAQYELDLVVGSPISGRIQGDSGQPVEGADVDVSLFGPRDSVASFSSHWGLFDCMAHTNAKGEWRLDRFPDALDGLCIRVTHPDYQPTTDYGTESYTMATPQPLSSLRDGTSVITLKRGNLLGGQILGADGKPLENARLVVGKDIWGTNMPETQSRANGHFVFKGLPSGENFLTIQATGHKPKIVPLTLPLTQSMDAIHLEKGRLLRGHVIDAQGNPCVGAELRPDTWNKLRTLELSLTTDTNGDFTWNGAPDEPVTFSVAAARPNTGFISDLPLQASDTVQTISLKPALHLTAQVVDDKTGQPLAKFRVTPGLIFASRSSDPVWETQDTKSGVQGTFDWSANRMGPSLVFKVEADGYTTLISDPYKTTQSDYTATFRLVKVN